MVGARLVTEVRMFSSFACGPWLRTAYIDTGYRSDDRRVEHFVSSLAYGRNT
jgi:hypothetical protein